MILGNPIGYAFSICQRFIQLFDSPRKEFINGPLGLGESKWFGNLITTIIFGIFDPEGKISGTLLGLCEILKGEKIMEHFEDREPDNALDGIYKLVKEGLHDLGKEIWGIIFKSYEGTKKEWGQCFFKGIGIVLIGSVVLFKNCFDVFIKIFIIHSKK